MSFYIAVTPDENETPIATAETQKEMARILGMTKEHICRCVHGTRGFGRLSKVRVYRIEEEENGETT